MPKICDLKEIEVFQGKLGSAEKIRDFKLEAHSIVSLIARLEKVLEARQH